MEVDHDESERHDDFDSLNDRVGFFLRLFFLHVSCQFVQLPGSAGRIVRGYLGGGGEGGVGEEAVEEEEEMEENVKIKLQTDCNRVREREKKIEGGRRQKVHIHDHNNTSMTSEREAGKKVMKTTKFAMMDIAPNQQTISSLREPDIVPIPINRTSTRVSRVMLGPRTDKPLPMFFNTSSYTRQEGHTKYIKGERSMCMYEK